MDRDRINLMCGFNGWTRDPDLTDADVEAIAQSHAALDGLLPDVMVDGYLLNEISHLDYYNRIVSPLERG